MHLGNINCSGVCSSQNLKTAHFQVQLSTAHSQNLQASVERLEQEKQEMAMQLQQQVAAAAAAAHAAAAATANAAHIPVTPVIDPNMVAELEALRYALMFH